MFKMVRLFRKLTALRILLNALSSSVIPVLYSFMILLLVSSLYAVLSTDLFGKVDFENFGSFTRSLFSLFQVLAPPAAPLCPCRVACACSVWRWECRAGGVGGMQASGGDGVWGLREEEE